MCNDEPCPTVRQAAHAHRKAMDASHLSRRWRAERNKLIRKAVAEGHTDFRHLAREIGCSQELIVKVVRERG